MGRFKADSKTSQSEMASKTQEMSDEDNEALISQLRVYRRKASVGQDARNSNSRKGAKFRAGLHWNDKFQMSGKSQITANIGASLYERFINTVTTTKPIPLVSSRDGDDDTAQLIQGAILDNWTNSLMQAKLKQGALQAGFTAPVLWYVYWDQKLRGGIGDFNTRIIPAYRSIIDNKYLDVQEMKYVGFTESSSRAELTTIFPDKADEIEDAANANSSSIIGGNKNKNNPLDLQSKAGGNDNWDDGPSISRTSTAGTLTGKYSIRSGIKQIDPLSEEVEVEYLWIDDLTPLKKMVPKLDEMGRQVKKVIRNPLTGQIEFKTEGEVATPGPFGVFYIPNVVPETEDVMEEVVTYKYIHRRHIAWLPQDEVILWDVDWTGPIPLVSQRDNYPLTGYWTEGLALRLSSLQFARNIIYCMIMEKIKFSMGGVILVTQMSGLKDKKLYPRAGEVIVGTKIDETNVRNFPVTPIDASTIQMLNVIEQEMMKILGVSNVMQGEAAGRADSPDTYDKLLEAASGTIKDIAQMTEETIRQWCLIAMYYIQNYYTHEHWVETEAATGETKWKVASALACRGEFGVKIETGSMLSMSDQAKFARAASILATGVYTLPRFAKMAGIPFWQQSLKEKGEFLKDPSKTWLVGGAGASPNKQNTAAQHAGGQTRSHHKPGGK
jgi:hypothetical protein